MSINLNENQLRVEFRKPLAKNIVSRHSGSVLADDEPTQELSEKIACVVIEKFGQLCDPSARIISVDKIEELLVSCQLIRQDESVGRIVSRALDSLGFSGDLTEERVIQLTKLIYAPTYYYGNRLRHYVCRGEVIETADLLVRGCHPNCADGEGLTPLHYAAEFNKVDSIYCLFEKAKDIINVDAKDKYGWTPLMSASHHGNHKCVRLLLKFGASVTASNNIGKTPLHIACGQNRIRICDTLVAAGGQFHVADQNGMTPLHDAAFNGHRSLVDKFINSVNSKDVLGFTPADYLLMNEPELYEISGDKESPLPTPREFPPAPDPIVVPIEEPPVPAAVVAEAKPTAKKGGKK